MMSYKCLHIHRLPLTQRDIMLYAKLLMAVCLFQMIFLSSGQKALNIVPSPTETQHEITTIHYHLFYNARSFIPTSYTYRTRQQTVVVNDKPMVRNVCVHDCLYWCREKQELVMKEHWYM